MAKSKPKEKRPPIPISTQLKLWVNAGGRCEFQGCNEFLLMDELTLRETNYANIAHIVSWQLTGPRGEDPLSLESRNEFENLMLACLKHHKLIDCKEHEKDYPKELLLGFKRCHEERIDKMCSSTSACKTTVIRLKAKIGHELVGISDTEAMESIFPDYYPTKEGIDIDFTGLPGEGNNSFWDTMKIGITQKIETLYNLGFKNRKIEHLSVFAIGPIPLLIHLGFCLGNKNSIQLYQRHRDTKNWKWKQGGLEVNYTASKLSNGDNKEEAILILSLSGKIHHNDLPIQLKSLPIYEITLDGIIPNPGFLQTTDSLEKFRNTYMNLLGRVKQENENLKIIHLFPAIPAPIAVMCGIELMHKAQPALFIYDYDKKKNGFNFTLEVNSNDQ